jgi:hypothetical protein
MLEATFAALMLFAFRSDAAHTGPMCKVAGHPAELADDAEQVILRDFERSA